MSSKYVGYTMKEFVKNGVHTWHVFKVTEERRWWGAKRVLEHLVTMASFQAAEDFISDHAGGYYSWQRDYDMQGRPIFYGW